MSSQSQEDARRLREIATAVDSAYTQLFGAEFTVTSRDLRAIAARLEAAPAWEFAWDTMRDEILIADDSQDVNYYLRIIDDADPRPCMDAPAPAPLAVPEDVRKAAKDLAPWTTGRGTLLHDNARLVRDWILSLPAHPAPSAEITDKP